MNTTDLNPIRIPGVELVVDTTQGLGYATLAGLERIFEGKTSGRTIARRLESFKRVADYGVINAETLTAAGLRSVAAGSSVKFPKRSLVRV